MAVSDTVFFEVLWDVIDYVRDNPGCTMSEVSEQLEITEPLAGQCLRHAILYEHLVDWMVKSRKHYKCSGRVAIRELLSRKWV